MDEYNIKTIIILNILGRNKAYYTYSQGNNNATITPNSENIKVKGSTTNYGSTVNYTSKLSLKLEIYSIDDNFDEPDAVLTGIGTGFSGPLSSEQAIAKKNT